MNSIHPTAVIGKEVKMGEGNIVGPYAMILGNVDIGNNNAISAHSIIGSPAEHKEFFFSLHGHVRIGNNCVIREFTTINASTNLHPTVLGNNVIMLRGSHVGHDAFIEDNVTLSCNAIIGGHAHVCQFANLGLGTIVHQHCVVGGIAMLGMASVVTKKTMIKPCGVYAGNPARYLKDNVIGIRRSGLSEPEIVRLNFNYAELLNK